MPITTLSTRRAAAHAFPTPALRRSARRRRRASSYAWYPVAEAVWALFVIVAVCVFPLPDVPSLLMVAVLAPGAFFATVRIVAGIAVAVGRAR